MTDFAPGDVVVCVDAGPSISPHWKQANITLKAGRIYRVERVIAPDNRGVRGVVVEGCYSEHRYKSWAEFRFRKLRAADEQFTEQMRALRPAKEPVK